MKQTQVKLNNGLNTLFLNTPGANCASIQIWFRAGSALETGKDLGIAHFLEHMFFKGTKKRPGAAIAHEVESYGGEVNAFTSFDYTCYYINSPSNKINKTIEILMDMVSNPIFDQKELEPERHVVHEEFRRSLDSPSQFNFKNIQKTSFTKGYSHGILGTEKTILNFSRKQLIDFRKKFYNLSNALLIVAGDIKNQKKVEDIISKYKIPNGPKSSFTSFDLKKKTNIKKHTKHVNEVSVTFTIEAPEYTDRWGAIEDLALNCIAHGEISPLYTSLITNTNLASSTSGSSMFFSKGGVHFLKVVMPKANVAKTLSLLKKELKNIIEKGLTEDQISRIKNQYVASKIYEKESIESHSFSLGHGFAQTGDINCEEQFIRNIKDASTAEVNQALKRIFKKTIHATIQTPEDYKNKNLESTLEKFISEINNHSKKESSSKEKGILRSKYDPEVQVIDIKKGIKLLYRQNKVTPTFVLHAYMKGGLSHETKDINGSYYFLSRLLAYGNKNNNFVSLKNDLENMSSYLNGFSGKNAYGLTLHGLSDNFTKLTKHFADTLLSPSIPKNYLELEMELIKRTIENQKEDSLKQCFREVTKSVFNEHPYSMPVFGTLDSIDRITREKLLELHNHRLNNSELLITYCGDKDLDFVKKNLSEIFDSLEPRKKESRSKNKIKPKTNHKLKLDFDREQTQIFIGAPAYKSNQIEDLYLKMLTSFLSGQSSELFVEVRDRQGLCYSVQPIQHTALEAGYWGIYIGAGADKTDQAKDAIINILNKLKDKGLSKKDFNRVKSMIDGQNQMSVQTNDDYANFYSISVLHGIGLDYQHTSLEKIRNIKHEDFNKFLKKFLNKKWSIIEAGK
ncbi:MAG: insulinase family protein [Bacteriovoracaceae bacterium]|jgi:zinc protease|nr:insulinase family protein [Bacteriovoracaceae bacterium]